MPPLSRLLRKPLRSLKTLCVSPPFAGGAYVVGIAAWCGTRASADGAGDMRRAEAFETFIDKRLSAEVVRMKIGVIATALALGLVLGLVAEILLRLRHPAPRRARRSTAGALVESVLLVAALHAMLVLWAMADTPQLYAASWYAQGGYARTTQLLATDWLGTRGVVIATIVLAIVYVRPARIAYLARRATIIVRVPWRAVVAMTAKRSIAPMIAIVIAAAALAERSSGPVSTAHAAPSTPDASATASEVEASASAGGEASAGEAKASAGEAKVSDGAGKPVNVLILAAASLRADRLDARIAPNLTALAARGTRFDRAYVSLPRTFPSWVTILTGRHAHHHGVRSMFPTWEARAKDFDALPSRFGRAGYATAVVSDYAGDVFGRVDLGFGRVDAPAFEFRQVVRRKALERETPLLPVLHSHVGRRLFPVMRELGTAADPMLLADDVEAILRAMKDKPFFVTALFSTAHFPYAAPAPHYAKYTDPKYRGRFKYHEPLGRATEVPPDADDVRQIRALYDGAVTSIDDGVGRVLRALERLDLAERTIVVVTADHGETLFDDDHGQGHGDHLFGDAGTHVPFVIYDPRLGGANRKKPIAAEGRREGRVVRDVDLAPTLYELAGVAPPPDLDGRSLAPAMRGEPLDPRFAYAETELWFTEDIPALDPALRMPYPGVAGLTELDARREVVLRNDMQAPTLMARHRMVRDERYKLLYIPARAGVRYMLFDTAHDPGETKDVAQSTPNEVARLKSELWSWMLADPRMEQKDGYLVPRAGAFAAANAGPSGNVAPGTTTAQGATTVQGGAK